MSLDGLLRCNQLGIWIFFFVIPYTYHIVVRWRRQNNIACAAPRKRWWTASAPIMYLNEGLKTPSRELAIHLLHRTQCIEFIFGLWLQWGRCQKPDPSVFQLDSSRPATEREYSVTSKWATLVQQPKLFARVRTDREKVQTSLTT